MKLIRHDDWVKGESYQKKILLDNFDEQINLVEEAKIEANGEIPLHQHNITDEIFYIIEGSAMMIVADQSFKVKVGDMIYVNKNEEHGFKNKNNKELKMIVMKINFKKGDSYLK